MNRPHFFIYPIGILIAGSLTILIPKNSVNSAPTVTTDAAQHTQRQTAETLNQQGLNYLAVGQASLALDSWRQANKIYTTLQDREGMIGTEINQAQALQSLGFYRQALVILRSVKTRLQKEPSSSLKAKSLLSLGNTLKSLRILNAKAGSNRAGIDFGSQEILTESLNIALDIRDTDLVDRIKFSLAQTLELTKDPEVNTKAAAIKQYQEVINSTKSSLLKIQAQINSYRLDTTAHTAPRTLSFITSIKKDLDAISPSHSTIYAYINLATIIQEQQPENLTDPELLTQVSTLLTQAIAQSRVLKDSRGEAQALGTLGRLYQITKQYKYAQTLTEQSLLISESLPAPDISYRFQWQLGKILTANNPSKNTAAITAYRQAINHLKTLRNDLAGSDADLQFSFRDSVDPVYREFVDLLLKGDNQISDINLADARDLIESLQVAELENFLRQGCLDTYKVQLDKIDRSATIVYPIILRDRLAVITSIPRQPLRYHSRPIAKGYIERTVRNLREKIFNTEFNAENFQQQSKQIYDLLIAPVVIDLQKSNTQTLVFVLDGALRNLPMSVLYDGKSYLFEKYNLALTPGLQLVPPKNPLDRQPYRGFLGGISEARPGFPALSKVETELNSISNLLPNQKLLNSAFNQNQAINVLSSDTASIVHLATHGEFSSDPEKTFILTWDSRLNLNQFNNLLQNRNSQQGKEIDLLILSACETARGDSRATLGLAGMAIQARTRSTIASLWKVEDESTQLLMTNLYENLITKKLSKGESLRLAQRSLLNNPKYRSPFYWAPFVLVGNWQ